MHGYVCVDLFRSMFRFVPFDVPFCSVRCSVLFRFPPLLPFPLGDNTSQGSDTETETTQPTSAMVHVIARIVSTPKELACGYSCASKSQDYG
jgi:hypothetical protein